MNSIEQKIYNHAKGIIPQALIRVKQIETKARLINIPFSCDGCIYRLIFDKEVNGFTKIIYSNVKGGHMTLERVSSVGYFDDIEVGEIEICR